MRHNSLLVAVKTARSVLDCVLAKASPPCFYPQVGERGKIFDSGVLPEHRDRNTKNCGGQSAMYALLWLVL